VEAKRKLRWVMLLYAVIFLGLCGYFTVAGIRKIEDSDGEQLSQGFVYGLATAVTWVSFGVIGGLCLGKFLTGFRGEFRLQELVVSYHDRLRDLGQLPDKKISEPDGACSTRMPVATANFKALTHTTFREFVRSHRFVVVHFWAIWNGYDVAMRRLIESAVPAELHEQIHFATFDIDPPEHHEICREHRVMGPPFLAYYRDGLLAQTVVGLQTPEVMIQNLKTLVYGAGQTAS
jgi:hypothetical protein